MKEIPKAIIAAVARELAFSLRGRQPFLRERARSLPRLAAAASKVGMLRVAFTGKVGGKAFKMATLSLRVPSDVTARIQECHILAGQVLSGYCEHFLCAGPRAVSR